MSIKSDYGTIRVVAAIVNLQELILYKESGETVTLQQGDPRVPGIVALVETGLDPRNGTGSVVEVSLLPPEKGVPGTYQDFEKKSGGLVRLFKVAKTKLASLFGGTNEQQQPRTIGTVPSADPEPVPVPTVSPAVAEILAHATPAADPAFHDRDTGEGGESTIVAVVGNKVISGVEKLKPQLARSVSIGSTTAMDNFLSRIAKVIDKRRHSVNELLVFLEKGDLPIAEDGSLLVYKMLDRHSDPKLREQGYYLDCHSKKVIQRVGSFVCMDESLVDDDRRQECSVGLHVATRRYMAGFGGNVITLAKVAPEDVIAVPLNEATKMRVCGYQIICELPQDAFEKLKRNVAFTDTDKAQQLLGRAIAGDHPERIEEVRITQARGGGVVITPITKPAAPAKISKRTGKPLPAAAPKAEALPEASADVPAPAVNPTEVAERVAATKIEAESRSEKAKRLWGEFRKARTKKEKTATAQVLLDFKKSTKKGWTVLGLPETAGESVAKAIG